jgi:hypothetical protein
MMNILPDQFCWTRFGTEASQTIEQILNRKEQERLANSGTFFWGIGNAIGPSMRELVRLNAHPEVLFSPIKGKPRPADIAPPSVAAWASACGIFGEPFAMPKSSLITSRFDPTSPKTAHYALVCHSDQPLTLNGSAEISAASLRNLLTGRSVGASQVTAVVDRRLSSESASSIYTVAFRTRLIPPYLIRLSDPFILPPGSIGNQGVNDWTEIVQRYRESRPRAKPRQLGFEPAFR